MTKLINHKHPLISRKLILSLVVFFFVQNVCAQLSGEQPHVGCEHFCARVKTSSPPKGIYEQDNRLHDYDIKFYGLDLEVSPPSTFLDGHTRVVAEVTEDTMRTFVLELWHELQVNDVIKEGNNLTYSHDENVLEIELEEDLYSGGLIDVKVYYSGQVEGEGFFTGIQSGTNSFGDPVLWTLSEPHNARQWFPCKQVLEDKADSAWVFITTPSDFVAASNGLLHNVEPLDNNRLRYEWKTFYPTTYYLLSMAVGYYQEYNFYAPLSSSQDSVIVQNFIYDYPEVLESQKDNLEKTKDFMHLFSQIWGNYPFAQEKYGHAQAPMGGAMEHQTISTMGYFGFDITAHELAHHWFGNQVSCATWSDIWINEGFASYGEYLAREHLLGREEADSWMTFAHSNVKSEPGGSVYVPPMQLSNVWRIFNGRLSYRKGAAIIHLLRFEINDDELFFHIMKDFQNTFAHGVATGDDYRNVVEKNTGQSWEWFFDQWYYGEGFPVYEIKWWEDNGFLFIQSSQTTSANLPGFFAGTVEFLVKGDFYDQQVRLFQEEPLQLFKIPVDGCVEEVVFDPDEYMLMDYVLVDSSAMADPVEVENINIGPNPVIDLLNVYFERKWDQSSYNISDLPGRILKEGDMTSQEHAINLEGLKTGMYLLNIISRSGSRKSFRFFKN